MYGLGDALAHVRERVREGRLRVRELGHAPASAHKLEHHAADLVDVDRLTDALRNALANVPSKRGVRVGLGVQQVLGRELADRGVLPRAVRVEALHVEDARARELAAHPVIEERLAAEVQLAKHLELRLLGAKVVVHDAQLAQAVEADVGARVVGVGAAGGARRARLLARAQALEPQLLLDRLPLARQVPRPVVLEDGGARRELGRCEAVLRRVAERERV